MTGYKVNPAYLHGYASQIWANRQGSLAVLARYASEHCRNFDRVSGMMEPAEWLSKPFADITVEQFLPAVSGAFGFTSDQLTATATTYETAEKTVMNRLATAVPGQGGGAGTEPPAQPPQPEWEYVDPATLGFTNGADVAPVPPPDENLSAEAVEKINDLLGPINDVIKKFTGYDVIKEWAPVILGDWGALRRLAAAWNEVGHSLRAIQGDLKGGLDLLAPHWIAGDETGAAVAFANHMNGNMIHGLTVYAELTDLVREWYEFVALGYEAIVTNAIWLVEYYGVRFKSVIKKISQAVKDLSLNPKTWIDLIDELISVVEDYLSFIKTTIDAIDICIKQFCQFVEMMIEGTGAIIEFFAWKVGPAA